MAASAQSVQISARPDGALQSRQSCGSRTSISPFRSGGGLSARIDIRRRLGQLFGNYGPCYALVRNRAVSGGLGRTSAGKQFRCGVVVCNFVGRAPLAAACLTSGDSMNAIPQAVPAPSAKSSAPAAVSAGATPARWTVAEIEALFALPFMDLVWRAAGPSPAFRCQRYSTLDAAFRQDRRLLGRLWLLLAVGRQQGRAGARKLMPVEDVVAAAKAAKARRVALAWGRLARAEGKGAGAGDDPGEGPGLQTCVTSACCGMARPKSSPTPARLLQPQPRYRRRVLRAR